MHSSQSVHVLRDEMADCKFLCVLRTGSLLDWMTLSFFTCSFIVIMTTATALITDLNSLYSFFPSLQDWSS